jgi:hypothetical protein
MNEAGWQDGQDRQDGQDGRMLMTRSLRWAFVMFGLSIAFGPTPTYAQRSEPGRGAAQGPTGEVNLTATSANVSESGSPVRIRILRWSTDEERSPVVAALTPAAPVAAPAAAATNPPPTAGLPAGAGPSPPAAAGDRGGAARGGRGGAGRGGRGGAARGGRGGAAAPNPMAALTAAIGKGPTLGYIWTNDVTGYSIKYAWHASLPNGGERIILATDRRLGAYTTAWKPVAATPVTDEEFTLIEIRLDAKGSGEGKTSLTTKVILDDEAKTVALDNYAATPAILQNVKR